MSFLISSSSLKIIDIHHNPDIGGPASPLLGVSSVDIYSPGDPNVVYDTNSVTQQVYWHSDSSGNLPKRPANQFAGFVGGWRVIDHRWTLYGLKLGNPVYLVGQVKSKSNAMIAEEGLDGTLQNSIIEVFGDEDAPGAKATLKRGTELTNIGRSRSTVEMILPAMILFLGAISLLVLA